MYELHRKVNTREVPRPLTEPPSSPTHTCPSSSALLFLFDIYVNYGTRIDSASWLGVPMEQAPYDAIAIQRYRSHWLTRTIARNQLGRTEKIHSETSPRRMSLQQGAA